MRRGFYRAACDVAVLCLLLCNTAAAAENPPSQTELNGFLLGQYKKVLDASFGTPYQETTTEDGWVYRVYVLNGQSESYMVFKFTNDDPDRIFSMQIAGAGGTQMKPFLGLRLGDSKLRVLEILGDPSEVQPNRELKLDLYTYEGRNYSVEINAEGKLSSIQIFGYEGFRQEPREPGANIEKLQHCVLQREVDCLMAVLAPDFEAYKDGETYTFDAAARNSLLNPDSQLVRLLLGDKGSLRTVFADEQVDGEVEIRIYTNAPPGAVIKFPNSKVIREIVYKVHAGDWRVYEIQFR